MNGLHWRWHQHAALRICTAMQRHNIWAIPGSPGYQGHASGHRRPRSQEVPEPPRQTARHNSPGRHQGPPPGVGSPSGTYKSPLRPFAPRRDRGSPHTPGMQGGAPERHQETRNPGRSRRRGRTPPPAARRVVFHEGMDRGHGGPNDPPAQQTSSAADPQRRSKRPRTERAHIPTIPTPAERARQAALHTGPHQATDGASSSYAADTRPRGPAANQRPEQGMGGRTPQSPPPQAGHDGTGPGHGQRPPDRLGPYATGLPTPAATQPNRRGAEDAPQQRGHDAGDPGAD